jgi:hypothetical protein
MGHNFPHRAAKPVDGMESNTASHGGVNGTSTTDTPVVKENIY